jgi:hypothetical protein
MAKVRQATFTPTPDGGDIQATMQLGSQELITKLSVSRDDDQLTSLLDRLLVKIEQVNFSSTSDGAEIQANLLLGDQVYVSRWPLGSDDDELRQALDRLLDEISRRCVQSLMAELQRDVEPARPPGTQVLPEDHYTSLQRP